MLQRSYITPSCALLVEGLSTVDDQQMTLLTRFICQVGGKEISGGKELLIYLTQGVSHFCQRLISGEGAEYHHDQVKITPQGQRYQLRVTTEDGEVELDLDRIQLFDLMEVLDQLCLDTQTLPDVVIPFPALRPPTSPINPAVPAVVGITSVLAIALALWFVPIPEPKREETVPVPTPVRPVPAPVLAPKPITDPAELEKLRSDLFTLLDRAWVNTRTFTVPLTYKVTVDERGRIIGYKETPETRERLGEEAEAVLERMTEELPLETLKQQNQDLKPDRVATFTVTFDITNQLLVE